MDIYNKKWLTEKNWFIYIIKLSVVFQHLENKNGNIGHIVLYIHWATDI